MEVQKINYKSIYYPPGGILIWIIIFLELFTFGMALVAFVYYGNQEPEVFHQSRNNYDKVGHFAQGLIPALIIRELFIRKKVINNKSFFNFIIVAICLAISAAYEWIEWGVSISTGDKGDAFLGTQGDIWDTQSDMLFATIGACIALLIFSKIQDRQIEEMCRKS